MEAKVIVIQVGGGQICHTLEDACNAFDEMMKAWEAPRTKIHFTIQMPNGEVKTITIRDEDDKTVAYGSFEGLPSFLDYTKDTMEKQELSKEE